MKVSSSDYLEILHRALRSDMSVMNYLDKSEIQIDEEDYYNKFSSIFIESENYPAFVLHMRRGTHSFESEIEWVY